MAYYIHRQRLREEEKDIISQNLIELQTSRITGAKEPSKWLTGPAPADDPEGETLVLEPKKKLKKPPFYKVLLLNDDFTPMDFVVMVLEQIFRKSHEESVEIMLQVHNKGQALVGRYTRDVAETKIDQVIDQARKNEYPLQCTMEKE